MPDNLLNNIGHLPDAAVWLERLPGVAAEMAERWQLRLDDAYPGSNASFAAPATRGHERLVLKIQWPGDTESTHEAAALRHWNGDGAVRLIDHDAANRALLLEHCSPGTHLAQAEHVDHLGVLIDILPRLWKPAGAPFQTLADEAREWASAFEASWQAATRRCDRRLLDAAIGFVPELLADPGEQVLVHQDLHGENIVAAQREPWLVIDPKPLLAEREFALAPIIRSFEFGHSRTDVVRRLDRLTAELGLDRQRAGRWAIVQTIAWSFDVSTDHHFETAEWLLAEVA